MSRDWAAIYSAALGKPKYRRLSPAAKGALLHVWLLAGRQSPEATWPHRVELAEVLELDGFPPDALDELLERRWLDLDPAGRVLVHDWDDHQLAATRAIGHAYEADRLRAWRRKKAERAAESADPPPQTPSPVQDTTEQDITGARTDTYAYVRETTDGLPHVNGAIGSAWETASGKSLIGSGTWAAEYIDDAAARHPETAVVSAIRRARTGFDHVPQTAALAVAVRNLLDPLPKAKDLEHDDSAEREAARHRRAVDATKRKVHELGGHADESDPACPSCQPVAT